jgi:hypothetical protein
MIILFPSEPFSPKEVDFSFKPEYEAAQTVGFKVCLFDHDEFVSSGKFTHNLSSVSENAEELILRSWMLTEEQYQSLYSKLFALKYLLINDPKKYLNCHHFPNAFPHIKDHTAMAWWTAGWNEFLDKDKIDWKAVRSLLGGDVIIKDYVKSEKGNPDLFILKKELTNTEFFERVLKFIEARGKLFNKGLVFKQVESLKKYDGQTNEWRIFFLNNKPINFGFNSEKLFYTSQPSFKQLIDFYDLAKKINSNFFTMDIAEKEDGSWIILELGDGQVSGLAAQEEPIKFYNNMYKELHKVEV